MLIWEVLSLSWPYRMIFSAFQIIIIYDSHHNALLPLIPSTECAAARCHVLHLFFNKYLCRNILCLFITQPCGILTLNGDLPVLIQYKCWANIIFQIFHWQCYEKEQGCIYSVNLKKIQDFMTGKGSGGTEDNVLLLILFKMLYHINAEIDLRKKFSSFQNYERENEGLVCNSPPWPQNSTA